MGLAASEPCCPPLELEHRPERWPPAFGKRRCNDRSLEHRAGSDIQYDALILIEFSQCLRPRDVAGLAVDTEPRLRHPTRETIGDYVHRYMGNVYSNPGSSQLLCSMHRRTTATKLIKYDVSLVA